MDANSKELLAQVLAALEEQNQAMERMVDRVVTKKVTEIVTDRVTQIVDEKVTKIVDEKVTGIVEEKVSKIVTGAVTEAETRLDIKIEHEVSRKIEALFDGYKLVHEKQWELARENSRLAAHMEDIEARLLALENKPA